MFLANFHCCHRSSSGEMRSVSWKQPKLQQSKIPPHLRDAMRIRGSLTKYIERSSQSTMQVKRLSEGWAKPLPYERHSLKLNMRETAWVREVLLQVNNKNWVYARTVIPRKNLKGDWLILRHLRQRALGTLLFRRQRSERGVIQIGYGELPICSQCLHKKNVDVFADNFVEKNVWARYSYFNKRYRHQSKSMKTMLVSEYFLEDFYAQT